ncbi:hypothetical protein IAU59_000125 [Kwoniella sp. CBS 9459]
MPPKRPSATYASAQGPSQRRRRASPSDDGEDSDDSVYEDGRGRGNANANANASQVVDDAGPSEGQGSGGKGMTEAELRNKAGQLVRFALFQEYKKNLIRRTDITKHVIPKHTRSFNIVFARAQRLLRETMGCELHEVRAKTKGNTSATQVNGGENANGSAAAAGQIQRNKGKGRARAANNDEDDDEEDGEDGDGEGDEAIPSTQRAKSTGTKAYILRSILTPELLAAMSNPAALPLGAEAEDAADGEEDSGALIRWEKGDGTSSGHIALLGIRTIILAVVMTLGRVTSDDQLHAYLRRLNLNRDTILPYTSTDSKEPRLTLDKYLDLLAKQSYLEKIKIAAPTRDNPDGEACEWRWGQREVEFTEKDAAVFIERVMLGAEEDDSSEDEDEGGGANDPRHRRRQRQRAEKAAKRTKLREDIIKAVGGPLRGVE